VVTTLLDAEKYPTEEITKLYRRRWQAEITQAECVSRTSLYQLAA
jgi:hypothetical protein